MGRKKEQKEGERERYRERERDRERQRDTQRGRERERERERETEITLSRTLVISQSATFMTSTILLMGENISSAKLRRWCSRNTIWE